MYFILLNWNIWQTSLKKKKFCCSCIMEDVQVDQLMFLSFQHLLCHSTYRSQDLTEGHPCDSIIHFPKSGFQKDFLAKHTWGCQVPTQWLTSSRSVGALVKNGSNQRVTNTRSCLLFDTNGWNANKNQWLFRDKYSLIVSVYRVF